MRILIAFVLVLTLAASAAAEDKLSAEEKAEVLKLLKALEKDPENKELMAQRERFTQMIGKRDLPVKLCDTPAFGFKQIEDDERYMELLMAQAMLALVAWYAEHPNDEPDHTAMNVYAAESALRAYAAARTKDPELKVDELEALLQRKDLKQHLEANLNCD